MSEATLSSPDPLNDSETYQSPAKTRCSSRVRRSLPLQGNSPTKQTFELDVGNRLSPQKIRVTVEAGESDVENAYTYTEDGRSPSPTPTPNARRRERTTTTTVPVKGLSDTEEESRHAVTPKRGRGRPRKSIGTPVPTKKDRRAGTPTQKRGRRSVGELVDGDDEEDVNFRIGKGVEIGRGKGRSRSRSTKGAKKATSVTKKTGDDKVPSSTVPKKGRGRRNSLLPEEMMVLENENPRNVNRQEEESTAYLKHDTHKVTSDPGSPFSTVRSVDALGGTGHEDITIARFNPGNETPQRAGWSSPLVLDTFRPSSSGRKADYPSPSLSADKELSSQSEDKSYRRNTESIPTQESNDQVIEDEKDQYQENQYAEEDEDEVGELHEFDTILESEGFSMISVDSVPSLREHFSSPANPHEPRSIQPLRNRNLLAVMDADAEAQNDSFSSIPEEILATATPARRPQHFDLLSVQAAAINESFSSIPPDILQAATPARKSHISRLLPSNKSLHEDSFSSIAPEILEAATPGRELTVERNSAAKNIVQANYEDSFSEVPPSVLAATTPAPATQSRPSSNRLTVPATKPNLATSQPSPRLITPDETPSPIDESSTSHTVKNGGSLPSSDRESQSIHQATVGESSFVQSIMPSSPPSVAPRRYTYTAHLRQHRQLNPDVTQTPSIVFSSPTLPPPIHAAKLHPVLAPTAEKDERPALSPIARAGRMLQDIVVPSSSRSRSQSLGSPFKSPAAERKSSSFIEESQPEPVQERRLGPLPKLDLNNRFDEHTSQSRPPVKSNLQEDPFSMNNRNHRRTPSPEEKDLYSLGLPGKRPWSSSRVSTIRSESNTVRSDDAMSWQAEAEINLPENPSSLKNNLNLSSARGDNSAEKRWSAERAAVSQEIEAAHSDQVIVINSDGEDVVTEHSDYDEDFGLLLETLNSSSPVSQQQREPLNDNIEKPRRSKIPSPWRQNSKRLVYSDETSHFSSPSVNTKAPPIRDFVQNISSQPVTARRIVTPDMVQLSDDLDEADLSGWQIPQKSNFKPRVRERGNLDLSALLATSPVKALPILEKSTQQPPDRNESLFGGLAGNSQQDGFIRTARESHPVSATFAPIPQKMGFNPRPRSPSKEINLSPSIIGGSSIGNSTIESSEPPGSSSPIAKPLRTSSLSRTNTLHVHQSHLDLSSPASSQDLAPSLASNDGKENRVNSSRTMKWAESIRLEPSSFPMQTPLPSTSPTKSCLRSPLKTPPANYTSGAFAPSPSKGVTFVSSSPMPSSPTTELLSSTTWSKDHWKLLDTLLQMWKPEKQISPNSSSEHVDAIGRRRRNSTRVISKLLGKTVSSNGDRMKLEQWHLEVVDEFRGYVPGWEEKVVAMRVFSLIVGEHKRGLVGK